MAKSKLELKLRQDGFKALFGVAGIASICGYEEAIVNISRIGTTSLYHLDFFVIEATNNEQTIYALEGNLENPRIYQPITEERYKQLIEAPRVQETYTANQLEPKKTVFSSC